MAGNRGVVNMGGYVPKPLHHTNPLDAQGLKWFTGPASDRDGAVSLDVFQV